MRVHLEINLDRAVRLGELAALTGVSPYTAQRSFKRRYGLSPLGYQRALRTTRLRQALKRGETVTEAIYAAGFGSARAAYESTPLGMTPARFARGGQGERIGFATARTEFGWMAIGATGRGICWLALAGSEAEAEQTLRAEFPEAEIYAAPGLEAEMEAAVAAVLGTGPVQNKEKDLRGTEFQLRVWQALQAIPRGQTRSYSELARELGMPKATRAVARACATNRVALLVPCHRVVGASGALTGYRWGVERKRRLLEAEAEEPEAIHNRGILRARFEE
jgi:AraC family transcriptional regulator of adaptative response/methylated-DNA-[protein]-cysteine methyltransferase